MRTAATLALAITGIAGGVNWAANGGPEAQDGREAFPAASRRMEVPSPGRTGSAGVYCAGEVGLDWEWLPERRLYVTRRALPGDAPGNSLDWVEQPAGVMTWITCDGLRVRAWAFTPAPPPQPPRRYEAELANGIATHYGESYQGQTMGCGGMYDTAEPTIVAVSPDRYADWPCGTRLRVTGPAGAIDVVRTDSCPGCSGNHIDLSEAGHARVCGVGTCDVIIEVIEEGP